MWPKNEFVCRSVPLLASNSKNLIIFEHEISKTIPRKFFDTRNRFPQELNDEKFLVALKGTFMAQGPNKQFFREKFFASDLDNFGVNR